MPASIGGKDLGNVQSETQTKDSSLFEQPIPASDSDSTFLLDLFGTSRNISISGIKSGSASELNTFITNIEGIMNGQQTSSTYVSSLSTFANKTVLIKNFKWTYKGGSPSKIEYSIELVEGLPL